MTEATDSAFKASAAPTGRSRLDVERVRRDFPILETKVRGKPLVYLDNAATTQKPRSMVEAVSRFYLSESANVHRGVHALSEVATERYDQARARVQRFLNAALPAEIIFVRGTTEAINLVAQSYGKAQLRPGDEVLLTAMEHHSNIVPWQMVCAETGARLRVIPISDAGDLDLEAYGRLLSKRVKLVCAAHVSNALGTVNPVEELIRRAHEVGSRVLIDGAQAAPHFRLDVRALDCDFYAFSGHKLYGPTGIGVLYGKRELLEAMPPYQGGGDMIRSVQFERTLYNDLPYKFEAGTPHVAGAVGLAAAIEYVETLGFGAIAAHEQALLVHAVEGVGALRGVKLVGTPRHRSGALSFVMDGVHPHDIGTVLDQEGIAIRAGHHCAQPLMERLGFPGTARASFALYNTQQEVEALTAGLHKVREVFGRV